MTSRKTSPTEPTLFQHLLNKANRYLVYPDKLPRGVRPEEGSRLVDEEIFSGMAGQRRTFTTKWRLPDDPEKQQRILDTFYCREVLKKVPEMIRLTLALDERKLPESNSEWVLYLEESASCLIVGLPLATVALARAAMESCLREAYAKLPGNSPYAARQFTLHDLISALSKWYEHTKGTGGLSPQEERRARYVQTAGNHVLHDSRIDAEEQALEVYDAARLVILSVSGS